MSRSLIYGSSISTSPVCDAVLFVLHKIQQKNSDMTDTDIWDFQDTLYGRISLKYRRSGRIFFPIYRMKISSPSGRIRDLLDCLWALIEIMCWGILQSRFHRTLRGNVYQIVYLKTRRNMSSLNILDECVGQFLSRLFLVKQTPAPARPQL